MDEDRGTPIFGTPPKKDRWWFGTSLLFFYLLGIVVPTDLIEYNNIMNIYIYNIYIYIHFFYEGEMIFGLSETNLTGI